MYFNCTAQLASRKAPTYICVQLKARSSWQIVLCVCVCVHACLSDMCLQVCMSASLVRPHVAWLSLSAAPVSMSDRVCSSVARSTPTRSPAVWRTRGWRFRPGLEHWAGFWSRFGTLLQNALADSGESASTGGAGSGCWRCDVAAGHIPQDSPSLLRQMRTAA